MVIFSSVDSFSEEEIAKALGEAFRGAVYVLKTDGAFPENANPTSVIPTSPSSEKGKDIISHHPKLSDKKAD